MSNELRAAQVEALGVNGLALARGANAIGIRGIPLLPGYGRFDGKLVVSTLTEVGPHDPDDRYHHQAFQFPVAPKALERFLRLELLNHNVAYVPDFAEDEAATVHLHWCFDGRVAMAKFESSQPVDLLILMNGCVAPAEVVEVAPGQAALQQGGWTVHAGLAGDEQANAAELDLERLETRLRGLPMAPKAGVLRVTGHRFTLRPDRPVYVALAETPAAADPAAIEAALAQGRAELPARLMASSGAAAHCADAIQRLVGFSSALDLRSGRRIVPVNRDWAGPNSQPPTFMWDNIFDSYLACFHNPALARESLAQILGVIRERGMAGAPPQRNLIVPIVCSKMLRVLGDRAFAAQQFDAVMAFLRFWFEDRGDGLPWRDGNDDGLIECGTCIQPGEAPLGYIVQNAFDETGYDDSPMYSAGFAFERRGMLAEGVEFDFGRGTLNLTMVGQNSLYVAACRAVAVVARWLGRAADERWLLAEAGRVAGRIQERLFDPALGTFQNRFFDGRFSSVKTMDLFYPLLAGVCDEAVRERLRGMLLDPRQFGGENVIPTVSRDDPAYGDEPFRDAYWRGNYWRGNVWPPTNYITYLAVRNAGWPEVAAEFAAKSRRLFMADWQPHHHAMENYPPEGHTPRTRMFAGNGGRDPHYIWSALLPLTSLEELFSVEDACEGVRFGSAGAAGFGEWRGFLYHGRRCAVEAGADGVRLSVPGEVAFASDGPVAVRQFGVGETGPCFEYDAERAVTAQIEAGGRAWTLRLAAGQGLRFL